MREMKSRLFIDIMVVLVEWTALCTVDDHEVYYSIHIATSAKCGSVEIIKKIYIDLEDMISKIQK